jgi:hypothetical protein
MEMSEVMSLVHAFSIRRRRTYSPGVQPCTRRKLRGFLRRLLMPLISTSCIGFRSRSTISHNSEACSARERIAAEQLLHPLYSMLYPTYMQLADAYQFTRIECRKKWLAVATYRRKIRDGRGEDKTNHTPTLQAHSLSIAAKRQVQAQPKDASDAC